MATVMVLIRPGVLTLPVLTVMAETVLMNAVSVMAVVLPMVTATVMEFRMVTAIVMVMLI